MVPSEINRDPFEGEFFTSASDIADRLVRESVQNSLDARLPHSEAPVKVRFAFSSSEHALDLDSSSRYLVDFEAHLEAVALADPVEAAVTAANPASQDEEDAVFDAFDLLKTPMTLLVVEDFGTTGLTGDIEANSEREEGNRFWGFFRSSGISGNDEGKGGSWGLGKWVFPDVSGVNACFGITRRVGEERMLLLGMAVLKTHSIDDGKFPPYGQFAASSEESDLDWLPMPIDSLEPGANAVESAISDFRLRRGKQSGLSVVIPWPARELNPHRIARSVLTQYFFHVAKGDLVVDIESDGVIQYVIDRESLGVHVEGIEDSERDDETSQSLGKAIELAKWAFQVPPESHIALSATISSDIVPLDKLDELRARFAADERLAFELSTSVTRRGKAATDTSFSVYLERDEDLAKGHDYFIRGSLRVPRMDRIRSYNARALIVVRGDSELGHLLRDAEGPAHVTWDPHAERMKKKWTGGYNRVQEVRRAAPLLLQALTIVPERELKNILADLFPRQGRVVTDGTGNEPAEPNIIPPLPSIPAAIAVRKRGNGFAVRTNPAAEHGALPGSRWHVTFAYDVARGGQRAAFRSFKSGVKSGYPDFSLSSGALGIAFEGCRYEILSENEISILVTATDFYLEVRGLDGRDITVEVQGATVSDGDGMTQQ